MLRRSICCSVLTLGLAAAVSAQQPAAPDKAPAPAQAPTADKAPAAAAPNAASAPTSAPAAPVIPVNTQSPRGTMKVLSQAMEAGDPAAIKKVMHAKTPVEEKMVAAMASQAEAINSLKASSKAKFGEDETKKLVGDTAADLARTLLMFDASAEKIEGETATVTPQGELQQQIHLVKVGSDWKLSVADILKTAPAGRADQAINEMTIQAKIIKEVAAAVTAGQYANAEAAGKDLQQKLIRAAMEQAASASGPASGPAATSGPSGAAPGGAPANAPAPAPAPGGEKPPAAPANP
jgi:hypothetical protein